MFCDLIPILGLPLTGIFTLRLPHSAMQISQDVLQSTGGNKCVRTLAFFFVAPVGHAVIYAADGMAYLQVFCREISGKRCPVSVC